MSGKSPASNKAMAVSAEGKAAIAKDEGFREYPYDDPRKFCTVGTGLLLHRSPCTEEEKKTKYEAKGLDGTFQSRVDEAARYVRHYVRDQSLTQAQFDSLTSFVYNVGVGQAAKTLEFANAGDLDEAVQEMGQFVNVSTKDKNGKVRVTKAAGLISRRVRETAALRGGAATKPVK